MLPRISHGWRLSSSPLSLWSHWSSQSISVSPLAVAASGFSFVAWTSLAGAKCRMLGFSALRGRILPMFVSFAYVYVCSCLCNLLLKAYVYVCLFHPPCMRKHRAFGAQGSWQMFCSNDGTQVLQLRNFACTAGAKERALNFTFNPLDELGMCI